MAAEGRWEAVAATEEVDGAGLTVVLGEDAAVVSLICRDAIPGDSRFVGDFPPAELVGVPLRQRGPVEYAIEGRRRVKEQLNKRKPDDEFASINLSFVNQAGDEIVVYCPESKGAEPTQKPLRAVVPAQTSIGAVPTPPVIAPPAPAAQELPQPVDQLPARERHYRIHYGATGYSYETILKDYLPGCQEITVEDPYIRAHHQIVNFLRFCETTVKLGKPKRIRLITNFDDDTEKQGGLTKLSIIAESLKQYDVQFEVEVNPHLHDREIRLSSGWTVKIGRGFDIYQRPDD